ncbi:MAG: Ig-like domain-containing protein, partial [Verrucomicrobia bacterium]|nr:Ig-like domain-containing protein [Verrucomicrobiota bacterium]
GEPLSFELTVAAYGESSTDTVSVTIVNVNHPPVAEAGLDQSIAEGSPVTLCGEDSFDIDSDPFTFAWTQVSGTPAVTLAGADTANPTFTAPIVGSNGAPGVVATLVFELRVDDGYPQDAPAAGYAFANVVDRVTVEITNVNNAPAAAAGADQTVDENSAVVLDGSTSSDPDSDPLTYSWTQTGGPNVTLTGASSATPFFMSPFVSAGGADLVFELTVDDGYGGTATDTVVVHVQNRNDPPLASAAQPSISVLWPPNHQMVAVGITGVSDPDNNPTITITGVTQDEPTNGLGDGDTAIDAVINTDGTVLLRSERSGDGDGRVYRVSFTASDSEGSASGVVKVGVPHSVKKTAIDSGGVFISTD